MNEKVVSLPPKRRAGDPCDVALNALRNAIETGRARIAAFWWKDMPAREVTPNDQGQPT